MKWINIFLTLVLVAGVISISGCTNSDTNQKNSTYQFENQYVKFQYPSNLAVQDNSTNKSLDLIILEDGEQLGEIISVTNDQQSINSLNGTKTMIASKSAVEYSDSEGIGSYISLQNIGIWIDFDSNYSDEYNLVKKTFVIKKNPSQ